MRMCQICNVTYPDNQGFCQKCGSALVDVVAEEQVTGQEKAGRQFCSECGAEIKMGSSFCPKCGKKIGEDTVVPYTETSYTTNVLGMTFNGTLEDAEGKEYNFKRAVFLGYKNSKVVLKNGVINIEQDNYFLLPFIKYARRNLQLNIRELTDVFSKKSNNIGSMAAMVCFGLLAIILISNGSMGYGIFSLVVAVINFVMMKKRILYIYTQTQYAQLPDDNDNIWMDEILAYIARYNRNCIKLERNRN